MKVAIDSGPLTSGHAVRGVGAYTQELIKGFKSVKDKDIKIDPIAFSQADLAGYDLIHYPYFNPFFITLPYIKPTKIVVTIHDLIPLIYPSNYPPGIKGQLRFLVQKFLINQVDGIITVSNTSKKDIMRFLGIAEEKIHVNYEASKEVYREVDSSIKQKIKKKYKLPNQFVLFVGDINYNKNILGLIEACKIAKIPLVISGKQALEVEELGMGLDVLSGPQDWFRFVFNIPHPELAHYKDLVDHFSKNKGSIIRLGYAPDEDLAAIYNLASVYCQPSFYEGFGLPVMEAMACGTPVVAARTQALVEIADSAAVFVDPKNPKDMAKGIRKVIKNEKLRADLSKMGKARSNQFSWKKTAKETISYYKKIIQ